MKRLLIIFVLLMTIFAPSALMVGQSSAVDVFPQCGKGSKNGTPAVCKEVVSSGSKQNPVVRLIGAVIRVVTYIVGVAAVIGIILSGIKFITANGDANSVAGARSSLIYALIGLAVVVLAQFFVVFVLDKI